MPQSKPFSCWGAPLRPAAPRFHSSVAMACLHLSRESSFKYRRRALVYLRYTQGRENEGEEMRCNAMQQCRQGQPCGVSRTRRRRKATKRWAHSLTLCPVLPWNRNKSKPSLTCQKANGEVNRTVLQTKQIHETIHYSHDRESWLCVT